MKKYAFFLPQFHEIKENNKWWGKGFTEWVNVTSAKPLYKGHVQPKLPLEGTYNLLDKKVVSRQTELMKEYNIDGLIYYHYYFTGKKLLEKPAENLLKWKDINQHFFFCWANHSWKKTWNGTQEILVEQTYGDKKDWEIHFQYLLKFFKDERYEKKDNKPLFMIFDTKFKDIDEMFDYFDKRCIENGFDGIYIIKSCNNEDDYNYNIKNKSSDYSFKYFFREPSYSFYLSRSFFYRARKKIRRILCTKFKIDSLVLKVDGNKLINIAIKNYKDHSVYHGLCFEWDNTPRHKRNGYIITSISKENFFKYMDHIKDEEYVFINAWNEWAEGMMLEPTDSNEYKYLEWIKEWSNK